MQRKSLIITAVIVKALNGLSEIERLRLVVALCRNHVSEEKVAALKETVELFNEKSVGEFELLCSESNDRLSTIMPRNYFDLRESETHWVMLTLLDHITNQFGKCSPNYIIPLPNIPPDDEASED